MAWKSAPDPSRPERAVAPPDVSSEFTLCQLVTVISGPSWRCSGKQGLPQCLLVPSDYFVTGHRIRPQPFLVKAEQVQVPQPALVGPALLPPIMRVALLWTLSLLSTSLLKRGAQSWTQCSSCGPTSAALRGRITSLGLLELELHLWMHDKVRLAFLTASPHCLPIVIFCASGKKKRPRYSQQGKHPQGAQGLCAPGGTGPKTGQMARGGGTPRLAAGLWKGVGRT